MADLRDTLSGPGPLGDLTTTRYAGDIFEAADDVDVFATPLIAGLTYEVRLQVWSDTGISGLDLSLRDGSGALLAEGVYEEWEYWRYSTVEHRAGGTGMHYLFASAGVGTGGYDVSVSVGTGTNRSENIDGTAWRDEVDGAGGDDVIRGFAGNDLLLGGAGNDRLIGGAGDDTLMNDSGRDDLFGGDGEDTLIGQGESDNRLYGGAGDDFFYIASEADYSDPALLTTNVADGGAGSDTVVLSFFEASSLGKTRVDLAAGTITFDGPWPTQSLRSAENATGGDTDDLIIGTTAANVLNGGEGDDDLRGGGGEDELNGGEEGDDVLHGGAGDDRLFGGDDFYLIGRDEDRLYGGRGDDVVVGTVWNDVLYGGAGDDDLYGDLMDQDADWLAGDDALYGGGGADRLAGGEGDDTLDGGTGTDSFDGGAGRDTVLYLGDANATRVDLAAGRASFVAAVPQVETLRSIENASTGAAADVLIGTAGANVLRGGGGADRLVGAGGADILVGGTGADVFRFLSASDSRPGQTDVLRAGGGAAAFGNPGDGAGDRIDLSRIDADAGAAGDQAFQLGSAAGAGRLWLTEVGASTVVRGDVGGVAGWEFELVIADGTARASAYGADDFVL